MSIDRSIAKVLAALLVTLIPSVASAAASKSATDDKEPAKTKLAARAIAVHNVPTTEAERARTMLPANPDRVVHFVRPKDTDPKIDQFLRDHYAMYNKSAKANGLLFIFFPGTLGQPSGCQLLMDTAAGAGYKVLGLEYVNSTSEAGASSVRDLTANDSDPESAGKIRQERITGEDASPKVQVTPTNAILNRIEKALAYLSKQYPDEGWGAYLKDGKVDWSKVAVGGHSQGAGMASFLAKRYEVARVCLFSGGIDARAAWVKQPGITPVDRYYGLAHVKEGSSPGILNGYDLLGFGKFGKPIPVGADGIVPDDKSHILKLTTEPAGPAGPAGKVAIGDAYHASVASDLATPKDPSGRPVYLAAWKFVLGP